MAKGGHVEAAAENGGLYPSMTDNADLQWSFLRKVYALLSLQLLLTVGLIATVVFVCTIPRFMFHTTPGIAVCILSLLVPFIRITASVVFLRETPPGEFGSSDAVYSFHWVRKSSCESRHFKSKHRGTDYKPSNKVKNVVFGPILCLIVCSYLTGKVILLAMILRSVAVIALTLYTFWPAKKGYDFSFMGPFLFTFLLVLLAFSLFQVYMPLGKLGSSIYGCVGAIVLSGYVIYDTDNLIKRFKYDEHVSAAVALYLDIVSLFIACLVPAAAGMVPIARAAVHIKKRMV
ncbi:protein LIFEGUARD 2-like [Actinidia eriantha]|uniref:protein LIFEGUARD 2-like n=1 Tax=Actinidia eriantha TaxID=165200 RepID=UPI00258750A1|nr:protein LIFEGUARD 2-like [Actinidia eriantha]